MKYIGSLVLLIILYLVLYHTKVGKRFMQFCINILDGF